MPQTGVIKWSVSAVKRLYVHRWSQDWDVWSTWDQVIHYFWSYAKLVLSLFKLTRIHTRCFHFMISPRSRHVGQMMETGNIPTSTTTAHSQHNTVFIEFGFKSRWMTDSGWLSSHDYNLARTIFTSQNLTIFRQLAWRERSMRAEWARTDCDFMEMSLGLLYVAPGRAGEARPNLIYIYN